MSDTTTNLGMPYILPSQAQKHVTHNEALQRLDAIVQLTIVATLSAPPAEPAEGACYRIGEAAAGEWTGRTGRLAFRQDGNWLYLQPKSGWRTWDSETGHLLVHDGSGWNEVPLPADATCQTLGVSTSADAGNRLAVVSPATLLTHDGAGHQLKINKAAEAETASLLFQSGWTGFAEMGLAGNNRFAVKVSDGADWRTAIDILPSGVVRRPFNPAFRAWRNAGTESPAAGSQTGFDHVASLQGETVLGAALTAGAALVVPAGGLYLLSLTISIVSSTGHETQLLLNGTTVLATCSGTHDGATALTQSVTIPAMLDEGNLLSIGHTGTAQIAHGEAQTILAGMCL